MEINLHINSARESHEHLAGHLKKNVLPFYREFTPLRRSFFKMAGHLLKSRFYTSNFFSVSQLTKTDKKVKFMDIYYNACSFNNKQLSQFGGVRFIGPTLNIQSTHIVLSRRTWGFQRDRRLVFFRSAVMTNGPTVFRGHCISVILVNSFPLFLLKVFYKFL